MTGSKVGINQEFNYTFAGKVLPERTYVTLGPIPRLKIRTDLGHKVNEISADVVINTAQIMVVARSVEPFNNLETLRNSIESTVRGIVDAYGYIEGRGYDVEITSVIDSTGNQYRVFPIEMDTLQATKGERPVKFSELFALLVHQHGSIGDPSGYRMMQLRSALGDLREAIRKLDRSALFCYRAIECLRQCYVEEDEPDNDDTRRASWNRMSKELRIGQSWISDIQEASKVVRHGGHSITTGGQRSELMRRTWQVVDRFIMSASLGFQPLSEEMLE